MIHSVAIYARVSTADQTCDRQVADLNVFAMRCGYKVVGVFEETASGAFGKRKVRQQVIDLAQARRTDAILVTELSRWGRSTPDLLETLERLAAWKVSVVAMQGMTFELNTPHGRMMTTLLVLNFAITAKNPLAMCFSLVDGNRENLVLASWVVNCQLNREPTSFRAVLRASTSAARNV